LKPQTDISVAIINQAQKGDPAARGQLYHHFSRGMFSICMRMAGERALAEDILHDAFITIFKNLPQLKQPDAVAGWMRRIVVNECIRQTSKKIKIEEWNSETADMGEHVEDDFYKNISLARIHEAIKELPDGCRQVFVLYTMEGLTHKNIAEAMGVSEGTSKSQYHRAKSLLKENITNYLKVANG